MPDFPTSTPRPVWGNRHLDTKRLPISSRGIQTLPIQSGPTCLHSAPHSTISHPFELRTASYTLISLLLLTQNPTILIASFEDRQMPRFNSFSVKRYFQMFQRLSAALPFVHVGKGDSRRPRKHSHRMRPKQSSLEWRSTTIIERLFEREDNSDI